ncbi:MAG: hypothetical protein U1F53_24595, partial [Burkholderiaceae bacterium]
RAWMAGGPRLAQNPLAPPWRRALERAMSKAAFSIKAFGVYLLVLGVCLVLVPNLLLGLFAMPRTDEVWIRVVGVLVFNIGLYYWFAAQGEATSVFRASIATRVLVLVAFAAFAALGFAPPMLVLFGLADFAGALWTWQALKRDAAA